MDSKYLSILITQAIGDRTLNGFCGEAGINAGNLSRVLRGQKASADLLVKIAQNAQNGITKEGLLCAAGYLQQRTHQRIPILGTAAAGLPIAAYEEADGFVDMDGLPGSPEEYFALRIRGNSMDAAHMPDQSIVVVHRQNTLQDGEIGVFSVDGEATVKRFMRGANHVALCPVSTDSGHQPQIYNKDDHVEILGRVMRAVVAFF